MSEFSPYASGSASVIVPARTGCRSSFELLIGLFGVRQKVKE